MAGVLLLRVGDAAQIAGEARAIEAALEHLGVANGAVGAVGVVHAVQREGNGVEVALRIDAGGIDELLVVGATVHGVRSKWVAARSGFRLT